MTESQLHIVEIPIGNSQTWKRQSLQTSPIEANQDPDAAKQNIPGNQPSQQEEGESSEDAGALPQFHRNSCSDRAVNLQHSQRSLLTQKLKESQISASSQIQKNNEFSQFKIAEQRKGGGTRMSLRALPIKEIDFNSYKIQGKNSRKKQKHSKLDNCGQCGQCTIF